MEYMMEGRQHRGIRMFCGGYGGGATTWGTRSHRASAAGYDQRFEAGCEKRNRVKRIIYGRIQDCFINEEVDQVTGEDLMPSKQEEWKWRRELAIHQDIFLLNDFSINQYGVDMKKLIAIMTILLSEDQKAERMWKLND